MCGVVGSFSEEVMVESVGAIRSYVKKERYSLLGRYNRYTRDRNVQSGF